MEAIKTLVTAFIGTFGFALLYGLRKRYILPASLGGLISWAAYLLFDYIFLGKQMFLSCLFATMITAIYVNILAYRIKAPTTLFLLPAILPLIPGSDLYYMFLYFYRSDYGNMKHYAVNLVTFMFAIAIGMSVIWSLKYIKKGIFVKE